MFAATFTRSIASFDETVEQQRDTESSPRLVWACDDLNSFFHGTIYCTISKA